MRSANRVPHSLPSLPSSAWPPEQSFPNTNLTLRPQQPGASDTWQKLLAFKAQTAWPRRLCSHLQDRPQESPHHSCFSLPSFLCPTPRAAGVFCLSTVAPPTPGTCVSHDTDPRGGRAEVSKIGNVSLFYKN